TVFFSAGFRWVGLAIGALAALYVGTLAGALRVLAETTLPRWLSQANVGRIQALVGLFGTLALVPAFAVAYTPGLGWLYARGLEAKDAWLYLPLTAPLVVAAGGMTALHGMLVVVACGAATALGAVAVAERMVSNGVVAAA